MEKLPKTYKHGPISFIHHFRLFPGSLPTPDILRTISSKIGIIVYGLGLPGCITQELAVRFGPNLACKSNISGISLVQIPELVAQAGHVLVHSLDTKHII